MPTLLYRKLGHSSVGGRRIPSSSFDNQSFNKSLKTSLCIYVETYSKILSLTFIAGKEILTAR